MMVVEGMEPKDTVKMKSEIEKIEHVEKVIWYDSVMDISVPMEMLPDEIYEAFNSGDATMMAIIFDETTSADGTMEAIEDRQGVELGILAGRNASIGCHTFTLNRHQSGLLQFGNLSCIIHNSTSICVFKGEP